MAEPLSSDLNDPDAVPYFLWDMPMTVSELRNRLSHGPKSERLRLLARVMREARDTEVWRFTTPARVLRDWNEVAPLLGHRRAFWEYVLDRWKRHGLLHEEPAQ